MMLWTWGGSGYLSELIAVTYQHTVIVIINVMYTLLIHLQKMLSMYLEVFDIDHQCSLFSHSRT